MTWSKEAFIAAQNSGQHAATVVAALVNAGVITDAETVDVALTSITKTVFNNVLALSGAETIVDILEAPAPQARKNYGGGGGNRGGYNRGGGSQPSNPGEVEFNNGKHAGKTIAEVYEDDPEYIEWFAKDGRNDFMKKRCAAFLNAA